MNYYIDCEFLEGTQNKRLFGFELPFESKPTIDLISIGIVAEDGREYYAVSKDFNLEEAWNRHQYTSFGKEKQHKVKEHWIKENVLKSIWKDLFLFYEADMTFLKGTAYDYFKGRLFDGHYDEYFTLRSLKRLIERYGKTNAQIAEEIKDFCKSGNRNYYNLPKEQGIRTTNDKGEEVYQDTRYCTPPIFYGYYCDYDWVAFCWLFGKMIDLPNGFPIYCVDLKQVLDEKVATKKVDWGENATNFDMLNHIKTFPNYPKQTNEHNALSDARWNKQLYDFLKSL